MQAVLPKSKQFEQDQQRLFTVEYWDTPFTPLENGEASGGIQFDLMNPKADGTWELPAYIRAATADTDISTAFTSTTYGQAGMLDGRLPNVVGYWAGGAPAEHGGNTNGAVAYHFYGRLRSTAGREWFDSNITPTWHLAVAGQGYVRIDKHVTVAEVTTVTTVFNGEITESDYLLHGFKFSSTINNMAEDDELHIYYVQGPTDPWGGLVVKAINGAAPSTRLAGQSVAATAPVLGCGLIDDGLVCNVPAKVFEAVGQIEVSRKNRTAAQAQFTLPLINPSDFDGVGWEYIKTGADDPGALNMWTGAQTPDFVVKRQRLVRIKMGFVAPESESPEMYTVFTGMVDDISDIPNGAAQVRCLGFEQRMLEQFDKNYPDKISYMSRGYRTQNGAVTGTAEPTYDIPALDNWPLEYAVAELLVRKGVDASRLIKPLTVPREDGTTVEVVIGSESFLKFRARTTSGRKLTLERSTHYGNNGVAFNESIPADDEYVFKPENTREVWKRILEMTDRYGYEIAFDEFGDCSLQPRNLPHAVFDLAVADATSGTVVKKTDPSAYAGTYAQGTGAVVVRKRVYGARIDVCLPRGAGLANLTCNVYRTADLSDIILTTPLSPASTDSAFFYDFRTTVDGTNATIYTVYSGEFDDYTVELIAASGTSQFDSIFTYHTDPSKPLLPKTLSTARNAISINTSSGMDEARNQVTVVGRRKAAVTDSEKFTTGEEFVVQRAVDVASIVDPDAPHYIGYSRESVIYNKDITDDDFAAYVARSFIYRQRVPAPSAPIEHTLLPVIQLRDPVYAQETRYETIPVNQVLYVTGITHRINSDGKATSLIETTGYPEFPSYEPREDIDIDQPEFGGVPVSNVSVYYTSLNDQLMQNLSSAALHTSSNATAPGGDLCIYPNVPVIAGTPAILDLSSVTPDWPPVPGTFFIRPNTGTGSLQTVYGAVESGKPGQEFTPISVVGAAQLAVVKLQRVSRTRYDAADVDMEYLTLTTHAYDSPSGFYYEYDAKLQTVTIRRAGIGTATDPTGTVGYKPVVQYYSGAFSIGNGYVTNNPYHHFFDLDYRSAYRDVALPWEQGDNSSPYRLPASVTSCDVQYRRLGPVDGTGYFSDPYGGLSPFYDPYTSELGKLVTTEFDALISGRYRVSIRDTKTHQVVAWLTEPTATPDDDNAHWTYLGAGVKKSFTWDGVDQLGIWNKKQSQAYAQVAHGEFEQDQAPVIGKGFYVWNRETDEGQPGPLALISGALQGYDGHPITTQIGAPVFGVSTYGCWYVKIEAQNDTLSALENKPKIRTLETTQKPADIGPEVVSLYADSGEQALIYTHLPRPSGVDIQIRDWAPSSWVDYSDATDAQKADEANWSALPDADATIRNDKPIRIRFTVQKRPGVLWLDKQDEVTVKLTRIVHPRVHIHDQYVVWDGTTYAGTDTANRRVESRRMVDDSHTIKYQDTGYRKAKDFWSSTNTEGTEWVFKPEDFKKNFRGIENESIIFGDYLQLQDIPKWDDNRQIGGARSRHQIAFMNYLWYLCAYTQDRSGRFAWAYNPKFVDKTKITTNDATHWPNLDQPEIAADPSTFRVPLPDDPMMLHRRTVVCRQWTDEKVDGEDWKTRETSKWALEGTIGEELLRHKWIDHEPKHTHINSTPWASFGLYEDKYSARMKLTAHLSDPAVTVDYDELIYPDDAINRQLGPHQGTGTTNTKLGNWWWESSPLWIPCITRDFHPYFLVPPMADPLYHNVAPLQHEYITVDPHVYNSDNNTGDDAAAGDTWFSPTGDMSVSPSQNNSKGSDKVCTFWRGTRIQKGQRPSFDTESFWIEVSRTDETVHYEDLRGIFSRGPRPSEAPKKVTPVAPYYVNPMSYDSFRYTDAYRNASYTKLKVRVREWFDMKFRSEYFVESGAWFPTDNSGGELLSAINYRLTRGFNLPGTLPGQVRYDTGAWTGWKDDAYQGFSLALSSSEANVFNKKRLVVAVGPRIAYITRDMIFHMVLINSRRETPATES